MLLVSHAIALNGRLINEWQIGKHVEGSGCGLFQGTIPAFVWRNWGKPLEISIRIVHVLAEIQTKCPEYVSEALLRRPNYSVTIFTLQQVTGMVFLY
jgi:hypothetical protein